MPGGRFSKQAIFKNALYLNSNNANDQFIGGNLSSVPSGLNASQGFQTLPGDRTIFSPSDALAYCNNTIANMFTGIYRYVQFRNNATANVTRTKAVYWDQGNFGPGAANDGLYQVTPDGNQANIQTRAFTGVAINNITLNNGTPSYWWIQESGKAVCQQRATITGNNANTLGQGVYVCLPAPVATVPANNNVDNGCFDVVSFANIGVFFAANNTNGSAYIDEMITGFVGVQESIVGNATLFPGNNNCLVDIPLWRTGWRW